MAGLSALFGVTGLLGIIIFGIATLINKIRKKEGNSKRYLLISLGFFVIGLIIPNGPKDEVVKESPQPVATEAQEEQSIEETEEIKSEDKKEEEINPADLDLKELAEEMLEEDLNSELADLATVEAEYKEEACYIYITPIEGAAEDVLAILAYPDEPNLQEAWLTLTEGAKDMSKNFSESMEYSVSVNIKNPLDEDKVVYSAVDGLELYNFMNE